MSAFTQHTHYAYRVSLVALVYCLMPALNSSAWYHFLVAAYLEFSLRQKLAGWVGPESWALKLLLLKEPDTVCSGVNVVNARSAL